MIDQLRRDIQHRLEQLLAEAEKLRHALVALGSHDGSAPAATAAAPKPSQAKPRNRARSSSTSPPRARTASGATKSAVLAALANGSAMTAGEVATATGLGRASVSTTLSKLAKTGRVSKAERGYQLTEASKPDVSAEV